MGEIYPVNKLRDKAPSMVVDGPEDKKYVAELDRKWWKNVKVEKEYVTELPSTSKD